jgi:hypothetical protein
MPRHGVSKGGKADNVRMVSGGRQLLAPSKAL